MKLRAEKLEKARTLHLAQQVSHMLIVTNLVLGRLTMPYAEAVLWAVWGLHAMGALVNRANDWGARA